MSKITWEDVLDIGLPEIDDQHRHLIGLSNSLIQAMINGTGKKVLETTFNELRDYTVYHFEAEEAYMEKIEFPTLSKHKEQHRQLTAEVDSFRIRLINDDVTPQEALDFINDWIVKHIMEKDVRIGQYAKLLFPVSDSE